MTVPPLWTLLDLPPTDERVRALMDAQQAELGGQDGQTVTEPFDLRRLAGPGSALIAAARGPDLLGCGGLRPLPDYPAAGRTAEVGCLYTIPAARGLGLGGQLLAALVERARGLGYARLVLETGARQPEAAALYERAGFRRVLDFGSSAEHEGRLCFGLELLAGAPED